jgi:hypothetical protein
VEGQNVVELLTALAGPLGGALAGWIVSRTLLKMYNDKDKQLIQSLQSQINGISQGEKHCNERFNMLLGEVFKLKDRGNDQSPVH